MDSEQFNNLVNNITNTITQVGTAAGNIYSSFRGNNTNSGGSTTTNNYVSSPAQTSSLPVWLLPVVGVGILILLIFKR